MSEFKYADEFEPVPELEPAPKSLKLASINSFGLDMENRLLGLGFVIQERTKENKFFVVATPAKLLGKDWKIHYQEKVKDPLLFTIYLDHGGGIVLDFLRQIKIERWDDIMDEPGKEEEYVLFFR